MPIPLISISIQGWQFQYIGNTIIVVLVISLPFPLSLVSPSSISSCISPSFTSFSSTSTLSSSCTVLPLVVGVTLWVFNLQADTFPDALTYFTQHFLHIWCPQLLFAPELQSFAEHTVLFYSIHPPTNLLVYLLLLIHPSIQPYIQPVGHPASHPSRHSLMNIHMHRTI